MRLVPTVVLVADTDLAILEPLLTTTLANLQHTPLDPATNERLAANGWTLEALAWSIIIRSFAQAVRDGHFEIVHVTPPT